MMALSSAGRIRRRRFGRLRFFDFFYQGLRDPDLAAFHFVIHLLGVFARDARDDLAAVLEVNHVRERRGHETQSKHSRQE